MYLNPISFTFIELLTVIEIELKSIKTAYWHVKILVRPFQSDIYHLYKRNI